MPQGITYVLGKDCKLFIDEEEIPGVSDVAVREVTTEADATGYGQASPSTVVTGRGHEITLAMPDIAKAREFNAKRWTEVAVTSKVTGPSGAAIETTFKMPQLLPIRLEGGLEEINGYFTLHEIDADQSLDGAVIPRFALRSWGGNVTGVA